MGHKRRKTNDGYNKARRRGGDVVYLGNPDDTPRNTPPRPVNVNEAQWILEGNYVEARICDPQPGEFTGVYNSGIPIMLGEYGPLPNPNSPALGPNVYYNLAPPQVGDCFKSGVANATGWPTGTYDIIWVVETVLQPSTGWMFKQIKPCCETWNCEGPAQGCVDPGDASGQYKSFNDCAQNCISCNTIPNCEQPSISATGPSHYPCCVLQTNTSGTLCTVNNNYTNNLDVTGYPNTGSGRLKIHMAGCGDTSTILGTSLMNYRYNYEHYNLSGVSSPPSPMNGMTIQSSTLIPPLTNRYITPIVGGKYSFYVECPTRTTTGAPPVDVCVKAHYIGPSNITGNPCQSNFLMEIVPC